MHRWIFCPIQYLCIYIWTIFGATKKLYVACSKLYLNFETLIQFDFTVYLLSTATSFKHTTILSIDCRWINRHILWISSYVWWFKYTSKNTLKKFGKQSSQYCFYRVWTPYYHPFRMFSNRSVLESDRVSKIVGSISTRLVF